jgi:hypothetical protein
VENTTKKINKSKTVAQALRRIKRLKGQHSTLTQRAHQSTYWVNNEKTTFEFAKVVEEREQVTKELIELKAAIARANANTEVEFEDKTWTIQELVFLMAELKDEVTFYANLSLRQEKESVEEVKDWVFDEESDKGKLVVKEIQHHSVLSERERVDKLDKLRQRIDELNDLLESSNHTTRLL